LLERSSLRDPTGLAIDEFGMKGDKEMILSLLSSIDTGANLPFRYYVSGSAFEYEHMKVLLIKYREIPIIFLIHARDTDIGELFIDYKSE